MRSDNEEQKLISRLKQGDNKAFEQLIEQFSQKVFATAFHMLSNAEDANDASQEAFIAVYKSIHKFRADSSLSTWIYRITINTCINIARKNKSHRTMPLVYTQDEETVDIADTSPTPEEKYLEKFSYEMLREAIDTLSPEHKAVIILRDMQNLTYEEIAQITNLPEGTVKSRINRARSQLRKVISQNRELF